MPDRTLNEEQHLAVTHDKGPLLIIAGAGTGKTTVVTERIKHLILEKKIPPGSILALTFTEKASLEMETRIDQIVPYGYSQMWIQTFHAFCDRLLRLEAIHIGLNPSFTLMTETQSLLFLRKHLFSLHLDYFKPVGNPMKFLQGMLQHFSRLRDDDINPKQYLEYTRELEQKNDVDADTDEIKMTMELANAFKIYEELKAREGVMDFSDLISNSLTLLRTRKNILRQYHEKFQYILVDEFQDTNFAQNEMAILLAGEKQNITVVGDDDQSIYRWRGAALANMMQFKSHFPKAKIVTLTKNYRSTQTILDSAYKMIQNNNPDRLEVKEKIDKKLISLRGIQGEPITLLYGNTVEDEAELVAKQILEEVKQNKRRWSDFAILIRANDHALPFQKAFARKKIPSQFLGPGRLFQQEEIKNIIAYLRVLVNFEDSASLYRILTMPIFDFQARDIAALLNSAKKQNLSLFETLEGTNNIAIEKEVKEKIQRFVTMMHNHLSLLKEESAGQVLYRFFEDSGLLGYYLDPRSNRTEEEALNIAKFFEKLQSFGTDHEDASVFAVVDWVNLAMELGESPLAATTDWTENNAVNILTVHSSKGLEFPVVFVVNLVTMRFPSRDRKEQIPVPSALVREQLPEGDENMQEERRLFYVAMTRARDKLFLTTAQYYGEGKRERKISPFILETLEDSYIQSVIKKQKLENAVSQLSLLEVLKPQVESGKENDKIHLTKTGQSAFIKPLTTISYSQLQTFDVCPLHYKLRYILKLPTTPSSALSFGTTIHAALKTIYQIKQMKQNIPEAMTDSIIDNSWISQGYENKQHEKEAKQYAKKLLRDYLLQNEKEVTLPAQTEMSFQFLLQDTKIIGRFDRIDKLKDGKIEIIDYKTGGNIPDERKLKNDLQLTLYALAATKINEPLFNKKPEDILLTLYYVEKNKRMTTTRSKEQLEEAEKYIIKKVEEIQTSDFHCSRGRLCQDCEYKILCRV